MIDSFELFKFKILNKDKTFLMLYLQNVVNINTIGKISSYVSIQCLAKIFFIYLFVIFLCFSNII